MCGDMRRQRDVKTGFQKLGFEAGDGALRRWEDHMQSWRVSSPAKRHLSHGAEWYLDPKHVTARPVIGMISLATFAERTLWDALTYCGPGARCVASAQRLMLAVQRRMRQLRYRSMGGRFRSGPAKKYLVSSVEYLLQLARRTHERVQEGRREAGLRARIHREVRREHDV